MAIRIQWRRDTAANWTSANPTLYAGEVGYETDTNKYKVGDGSTAWTSIADYFEAGAGGGGTWGSITGTLSAQTDLNSALAAKLASASVSAFGLTLIDDADASTARTTLGLGSLATQSGTFSGTSSGTNTGDQDLSSYATTSAVAAAYQPLDSNLTAFAGLGTALQQWRTNAGATAGEWFTPAAASGDVVGPASSTDNAIARFDSTTGKLLQDMSKATIADTGAVTITPDANATAITVASHTHTTSNPAISVSQTWNDAAVTFIGATTAITNTASAAASVVEEWKVDNNRVAAFTKSGGFTKYTGASTSDHAQAFNFQISASGTQAASGQYSFIGGGYNNTASGSRSVVLGGNNQIASGTSSVAIGTTNTASSTSAVAIGVGNIVTGTYSTAIGYANTCSGYGSVAMGQLGSLANASCMSFSGGAFAAIGDAQTITAVVRASTTDATQTTLAPESGYLVIPADTSWAFSALIVGRSAEADGNDTAGWIVTGMLKRDESNNTAIVGTITKTLLAADAGAAAWDVTIEANNTNEALAVKVTGDAATNIRWVARVSIASVTYT